MKVRALFLASVVSLILSIAPAHAAFHLFRIAEVYSNADGSVQYIVIREATGSNGENFWSGLQLKTQNAAGTVKTLNFPSNLASSSTASRSVLIATANFAALGLPTPDFTIPARFIPTEGGSINYANVDTIDVPPLPNDGVTAVDRNGNRVAAAPRNFSNATAAIAAATPVTAVEFYHAGLDHYFISSLAGDIDALDTGRISGWTRTGLSFTVFPTQAASGGSAQAVCRIIIPPPHGDSHFFGRSAQECSDTLAKFPFMSQETASAFFIALPAAGVCPAGTVPVYRVFDNRVDANHRYTTSRDVRDQMERMGWDVEGDGPDRVVMCATTAAAPTAASAVTNDATPMMPPYGGYPPPP